ncbi:HAMP domain-containing sensor histidine kinase [Actinotignum urinale]|uniref:sensor histidine kinase n=1 Tax=Actinotignum urinale TaxID=190146 RepID=UPI002A8049EC|nr:HAMP domain-containing sensor histidine kinase [Actinotignum urinale]MDY5128619.1 HAMP domain-containing sensor histidine kinase [Actinotignum urinale]
MRRRFLLMTTMVAGVAIILLTGPIAFTVWRVWGRDLSYLTVRHDMIVFFCLEIIGIVATVVLAVALALWQSRKISAPLIYLAAATEQLGSGTTRPVITPSGIEEIDLVFNEIERAGDRVAGRLSAERQFSADASHQLRTPLTSLSMRLEEIEYLTDDKDVKSEVNACLEQVERLTNVVTNLLESSHHIQAQNEAVALQPIFTQQLSEWARPFALAYRKITFKAGKHGPVLADPRALSQIIATLVENSLRYGKGTTTVTSNAQGRTVVIQVADEGKGVDEEFAQTIFTKGFSTGGSTGIGLYVARQLAQRNNGKLELTQAKPAVFSLVLSALPEELDPAKVLPAGGVIAVGARKRRI